MIATPKFIRTLLMTSFCIAWIMSAATITADSPRYPHNQPAADPISQDGESEYPEVIRPSQAGDVWIQFIGKRIEGFLVPLPMLSDGTAAADVALCLIRTGSIDMDTYAEIQPEECIEYETYDYDAYDGSDRIDVRISTPDNEWNNYQLIYTSLGDTNITDTPFRFAMASMEAYEDPLITIIRENEAQLPAVEDQLLPSRMPIPAQSPTVNASVEGQIISHPGADGGDYVEWDDANVEITMMTDVHALSIQRRVGTNDAGQPYADIEVCVDDATTWECTIWENPDFDAINYKSTLEFTDLNLREVRLRPVNGTLIGLDYIEPIGNLFNEHGFTGAWEVIQNQGNIEYSEATVNSDPVLFRMYRYLFKGTSPEAKFIRYIQSSRVYFTRMVGPDYGEMEICWQRLYVDTATEEAEGCQRVDNHADTAALADAALLLPRGGYYRVEVQSLDDKPLVVSGYYGTSPARYVETYKESNSQTLFRNAAAFMGSWEAVNFGTTEQEPLYYIVNQSPMDYLSFRAYGTHVGILRAIGGDYGDGTSAPEMRVCARLLGTETRICQTVDNDADTLFLAQPLVMNLGAENPCDCSLSYEVTVEPLGVTPLAIFTAFAQGDSTAGTSSSIAHYDSTIQYYGNWEIIPDDTLPYSSAMVAADGESYVEISVEGISNFGLRYFDSQDYGDIEVCATKNIDYSTTVLPVITRCFEVAMTDREQWVERIFPILGGDVVVRSTNDKPLTLAEVMVPSIRTISFNRFEGVANLVLDYPGDEVVQSGGWEQVDEASIDNLTGEEYIMTTQDDQPWLLFFSNPTDLTYNILAGERPDGQEWGTAEICIYLLTWRDLSYQTCELITPDATGELRIQAVSLGSLDFPEPPPLRISTGLHNPSYLHGITVTVLEGDFAIDSITVPFEENR